MELESNIQKWLSIGRDCARKGDCDGAITAFDQILEFSRNNITALYLKAEIYRNLNNYIKMEEVLLQALTHAPNDLGVLLKLCECYYVQHKYSAAFEIAIRAKETDQTNVYAWEACGVILNKLGRAEEAIDYLKQAIAINQEHKRAIMVLADIYFELGQHKEAERCYNMINKTDNEYSRALYRLCYITYSSFDKDGQDNLTRSNGFANELLAVAKDKFSVSQQVQWIALTSLDLDLQMKLGDKENLIKYWANNSVNKAFVYQKSRVVTMQDRLNLLEAHRSWGATVEAIVNKNEIKHKVRHKLNNKVRVGVSAADFRNNHVGYFIEALVGNFNRNKFEVFCYAHYPLKQDRLQQKIESKVDSFNECGSGNDHIIAQTIADDSLDTLIEIGSWFDRAKILAYKPAPIQISWLDYSHSLGLPTAIDYIVLDPYVKPDASLLIERPMVLPETWIVMNEEEGFPYIHITKNLPEDRNGYITFGAMNATYRLTEETFKVWARIMNMVPNSRLVYIRPEAIAAVVKDNFCRYMEKYGINRDRVSFIATRDNFMDHYNKIDIALDTFPHMGATTTFYTLWMGLPLVTLVGPCFFERVSYSALNNCGLGDLCATTIQEYQDIALSLVADKERRKYIRQNLRSWILNGPLGQPKRFTENMGNTIMNVLGRG